MTMDYFEWADKYEAISDEPLELEDVKDLPATSVWTAVDTDEGVRIVPGFAVVNRLHYYVTKIHHNFEEIEVD